MSYTLQILFGADAQPGLAAFGRADRYAAIVEALEGTHANSITLSGGDNVAPGPFTAAASDPSLVPVLRGFYKELLGLAPGSLPNLFSDGLPAFAVGVALQNAIGVQASAMGWGEFDAGPAALAAALGVTEEAGAATGIGALFPYLTANLDLSGDPHLAPLFTTALRDAAAYGATAADFANATALAAREAEPALAPWTTITEGGERIGVLAVTASLLAQSPSAATVTALEPPAHPWVRAQALATVVQPYLDEMQAQGINKIVLLSHLKEYFLDMHLASVLRGVDVVVSAGRNALFPRFGGFAEEDYVHPTDWLWGAGPTYRAGTDGNPVAIIHGSPEFGQVARLVVTFDDQGVLTPDPDRVMVPRGVFDGPLATGNVDPAESRGYAATDQVVQQLWGSADPYAPGTRGAAVRQITEAVQAILAAKDAVPLGFSEVFLEGRPARALVEETNLGNLVADATLASARQVEPAAMLAFLTGGALLAGIGAPAATLVRPWDYGVVVPQDGPTAANPLTGKPAGAISQLDIEHALAQDALTVLAVTAENLVRLFEAALAAPGTRAFPQVAGVNLSFDLSRPAQVMDAAGNILVAGERVRNLALFDEAGRVLDVILRDGVVQGDAGRPITLVTLTALAGTPGEVFGADGLPLPLFTLPGTRVELEGNPALGAGGAAFAAPGTLRDALAEHLLARHATPETDFAQADTPASQDVRLQDVALREDSALAPYAQVTQDGREHPVKMHIAPRDTAEFGLSLHKRWELVIRTTDAAELITAGPGPDIVFGNGGDDRISGGAGNDTLHGGAGNDRLDGDLGANTILGGPGNDLYMVRRTEDVVVELPGEGRDRVSSFISYSLGENLEELVLRGDDAINGTGNALDNLLQGNDAANTLIGGRGNDVLRGHGGRDILLGGEGRDVLDGGAGEDMLFGGAGNDRLAGGAGADELEGGAGADIFDFARFADSTPEAMDVVMDFQQGVDKLRFAVITAGGDPFAFQGAGPFLGGGTASLRFESAGEDTLVLADAGDGGAAELAFRLVGGFTLTSGDFLL